MPISIKDTIASSSKFSGVTLLSKLINMPKAIIIAMVLSPVDFGLVGIVLLVTNYATLINFGTVSVAFREIPGLLRLRASEKMQKVQNIAISVDILVTLVLFVGIALYATAHVSSLYGKLLLIAAIAFLSSKIYGYYETINLGRSAFNLVAKARLIIAIIVPLLSIVAVFWIGLYTLIAVPLLGSIAGILFFARKGPLGFQFALDREEIWRLLKIGISISAGGFLYNIFVGTVDQTVIASYLSKKELGLFIYGFGFVSLLVEFLRDIGRVLSPTAWAKADSAGSDREAFEDLKQFGAFTALLACIMMTFSQVGFALLVNLVTVKFVDSQSVFFLLTMQIYLESMGIYPAIILGSRRVNGQNKILLATGIGVLANIALDILAIRLGFGIVGVAAATAVTKGFTTILLYQYSWRFYARSKGEFFSIVRPMVVPFLIAVAITALHVALLAHASLWVWSSVSLSLQSIFWYLYLSRVQPEFLILIKDIARMIFAKLSSMSRWPATRSADAGAQAQ